MMKFLESFCLLLPSRMALKLGSFLGLVAYCLFKKRRELALDNINQALGSVYTASQQKAIIKKMFKNLGISGVEFFRFQKINVENMSQIVTFHGKDILDQAYNEQKGILALVGHIGNWELLSAVFALSGYETCVVTKKIHLKQVDDFFVKQRTEKKLKLLTGKSLYKGMLGHLKKGGVLGMVLDQSASTEDGVMIPFFDRPASTYKSLALLSLRSEAPIIPIYIYRDENFHHHVVVEPPIHHAKEETDIDAAILERTRQYNQALEKIISAYPEQWTWTHNRWNSRD